MSTTKGCLIAFLVILGGIAFFVFDPFHLAMRLTWGNEPFDSPRWKDSAWGKLHEYPNPRGAMLASFLRTHKLIGMTQADVTRLLGEPDMTNYRRQQDWDYGLGAYTGIGVDEDLLIIEFGDQGTVTDYYTMNT